MSSLFFWDYPVHLSDVRLLFLLLETVFVKALVESVEVFAVELIGEQSEVLSESLIMDNLTRSEKSDRVDDIRIVAEAQDVIVGGARLLLRRHTLVQIGDGISLDGK